jgi:hypothetical protein
MRGITGYISPSDIPLLDKIVQNTAMEAGRNLLIDILREGFQRDRYYRWLPDSWGFAKTPDHRGLQPYAGATDDTTTRLFIGAQFKNSGAFLPAVIVRQTSMSYKPVSFNQNKWDLEFGRTPLMDADGKIEYISAPVAYSYVGLWESNFEIKIVSRSLNDTTRLHDLIMIMLQSTYRYILQHNGLFIKDVRSSGEQSESIGANDPYYVTSISVDTLSEFRRRIPVYDTVDRIQLCIDVNDLETDPPPRDIIKIRVATDEIKIFFGADSFFLVNETNISTLPFYKQENPAGTYSINAAPGEFAYFAAPEKFDVTFSVGYFTKIRTLNVGGNDYAIYRSNATGLGAISFTVS